MASSLFVKKQKQARLVASGSGTTATNLGKISLDLDRAFLTSELVIGLAVSQGFAVAPSSSDVRRLFSKIELVSSRGTEFSCSWSSFYDLMRVTESSAAPIVVLGTTSTMKAITDLHFELDGCGMDVLTMVDAAELSSFKLELHISPDAANCFIGGTTPAVANISVTVVAEEYPLMKGVHPFASCAQSVKAMTENSGGAAATNKEVKLDTGNRTRFILLQAFDTTGAVPTLSDSILDAVTFEPEGFRYFSNVPASTIRAQNAAKRSFNQVGCVLLDAGDEVQGFYDLEAVTAAKLKYSTLTGAPASWTVTATQVYVNGLGAINL